MHLSYESTADLQLGLTFFPTPSCKSTTNSQLGFDLSFFLPTPQLRVGCELPTYSQLGSVCFFCQHPVASRPPTRNCGLTCRFISPLPSCESTIESQLGDDLSIFPQHT